MTVLTDEQQAFVGPIGVTDIPTHRARLARVVSVHFDRHRTSQQGFVGDHRVQLSKRPLRVDSVAFALLDRNTLNAFAILLTFVRSSSGVPSNVCQVLQAHEGVGMLCHDAFGDHMIGVGFQPSLSSTDCHQTAGRRT